MRALDRQHDGTGYRRLGDVLVEMGLLAEGTLHAVVRGRMQEVVSELLGWHTGYFRFEPAHAKGDANVEVDMGDFVLEPGAARRRAADAGGDRARPRRAAGRASVRYGAADPTKAAATTPAASLTGSYAADYTGEAVLSLLRFTAQVLSRAVVFAIEDDAGARGRRVRGAAEGGRRDSRTRRSRCASRRS